MKKVVLVFGLISGAISSAMMFLTLPLLESGALHNDGGVVLGYASILLSLLLVFFAIRSYRENAGGTITFGRAVAVGLLITLVSSLFYVGTWQIIYFKLVPEFGEQYVARTLDTMREEGASEAAIAAKTVEMRKMKEMYDNPLINAAVTLIEPVPVGVIVTLVSAAILRKRRPAQGGAAAVQA